MPATAARTEADPEHVAGLYARILAGSAGLPNEDLFAKMLASQHAGVGALPAGLGLDDGSFAALVVRHFPYLDMQALPRPCGSDPARLAERQDLVDLLLEHRAGRDPSEAWVAQIVAAACMGGDHLWQDLGLWSRKDLSRLMTENFPHLAAKNVHDMKWKRFLYKQLCQREGIYVCRAPSCEVCVDYVNCFGPEE